jgi:hypothetical protein
VVVTDTCPICRRPVHRADPSVVVARVRGTPEPGRTYFHERCYPGDEGTFFERIDPESDDAD